MTICTETKTTRMAFLEKLSTLAATLGAARKSRNTVLDLGTLDDNMLRDIGLSHADLLDLRSAPLSSDPDAVLRRARMRNMF